MNEKYTDIEEKEFVNSFENGEWVSTENLEEEKVRYKNYAKSSLKKDKRINIRISERDLNELQRRAIYEGIPYQTLISSILHKFVNGNFAKDRY